MSSLKKLENDARRRLDEIRINQEIDNIASSLNRARSITVGTAFGGTTEILMRGDGGKHMWCTMQPVEVIELIHQLSANVGCDAEVKPRKDFASWRDWVVTQEEKEHMQGHAPFVNDMAPYQQLGANMNKFEALKFKNIIEEFAAHGNVEYDENGNLKNKVILKGGEEHMLGGAGGNSKKAMEVLDEYKESISKKSYYKRKPKNDSDALATQKPKNRGSA